MFQINAPFRRGVYSRGRLIEGGVYFENFEKGGGRLKEGGRLIEVIR